MKIQNIIFDLGGVLIEWDPAQVLSSFYPDPEDQFALMQGIFDHPDWAEKDRGVYSADEEIKRFARRTGFAEKDIAALLVAVRDSLTLKADTLSLLYELREEGYPLYCLSNMPMDHASFLENKYDFWDVFSGIVFSGQVKMIKPELEIYQFLLREYQLEPETCVFIDDSPKNIEVARSLGIKGIVFSDVQSCRQQLRMMMENER